VRPSDARYLIRSRRRQTSRPRVWDRIESSRRIACRRIGGIAALIAEADRYLLATFYQENLNRTLWCAYRAEERKTTAPRSRRCGTIEECGRSGDRARRGQAPTRRIRRRPGRRRRAAAAAAPRLIRSRLRRRGPRYHLFPRRWPRRARSPERPHSSIVPAAPRTWRGRLSFFSAISRTRASGEILLVEGREQITVGFRNQCRYSADPAAGYST